MREVSKKHSNVLFQITGEGEDNGDLWKAYFRGGKMQMCVAKIVYDIFDQTLLNETTEIKIMELYQIRRALITDFLKQMKIEACKDAINVLDKESGLRQPR